MPRATTATTRWRSLDEINKDKKAKIALDEIKKIISKYLGLDEEDKWDGLPVTLKKQRSENKEE